MPGHLGSLPDDVARALRAHNLTYSEVGQSLTGAPPGFRSIDERSVLSEGADFEQVADALMSWAVQRRAGISVDASSPIVAAGEVAHLILGVGPVQLRSPVQVVTVLDESDRRGFPYGTLPGHPEIGEEAFVLHRRSDGLIEFRITAFSRPGTWWSRAGAPVAKSVQNLITRRYLRALGLRNRRPERDDGMMTGAPSVAPDMTPTSARAIVYTRTGAPDVLTLVDKALLDPGPGQVRVQIHRSGVNPTDWKSRQGSGPSSPVDPAQVPGQDGAGVIDAVGAGVDAARIGSRVWIWEAAFQRTEGTTQEYALIPDAQAVDLPDDASFDLGAGLGIPFLTAHRCLTVTEGGPQRLAPGALEGRHVLVAGGAGAVGNAAIQLAHWAGATVVGTVSGPEKAELALAAGADHVINYRTDDVVAEVRKIAPNGVNTIVEVSAARNAAIDVQIIARDGSIAMYADDGGAEVSMPIRASMGPNVRWQFVLVYTAPKASKGDAVQALSAALTDGAVREILPLHHFPLADSAAAHQAVQDAVVGKVLVDVI